jgi:signal transduction histidine kinase
MARAMDLSWKRLGFVALLGALLVGAVLGLAITLEQSRSRSDADLRRSAHARAALAAALIDEVFSSAPSFSTEARGLLARPRVTAGEIREALAGAPLVAVVSGDGRVLGARPRLPVATARLIAGASTVREALRTNRRRISDLLPASGRLPAGFLEASPYATRFGRRATVTWLPLAALGPLLDRYLSYVAHYSIHTMKAQAYLLDGHGAVIGSSTPSGPAGGPLADPTLRSTLAGSTGSGQYGHFPVFFTVAPLPSAPWRVAYTIPARALYASHGNAWSLSFALLACFGAAAMVCLVLLVRLLTSLGQLRTVNRALAERNREAERATEAKTRFVANMSHELRTPLNAVIGFSELMHEGRSGAVSETQREHLGIIRDSADHLLTLINEVLDLSRIEAGHISLDPRPIEPAVAASECVRALRRLAGENGVALDFDPRPVGMARLDPARFRQVILNFLSNALKFTGAGGTVSLHLARPEGSVLVEVEDSGPGIPAQDRERIFEEFVQLSDRRGEGTGLGLAVTKLIVEAQGGEVGVRSTVGVGSTFYARLPSAPRGWAEPSPPPGPGPGSGVRQRSSHHRAAPARERARVSR